MTHAEDLDLAHEGDDVERGGVVGVAEEVHEGVHDAGGDLGELDGGDVDGLDEELAVLGGLRRRIVSNGT